MGKVMLRVWIEVEGGLCGPCDKHSSTYGDKSCDVFQKELQIDADENLVRCAECLQAESKAEHQAGA